MKHKWLLRTTKLDIKALSKETSLDETIVKILVNRGIKSAKDIRKFMNCSIEDLYNPLLMKDMDRGTQIIKEAIEKDKKICIYGDYDAGATRS